MWINLLNVKIPYNEKQLEYRHINMFVWYQIRQMIDDNIELGKILIIDKDGFLRVNNDTDLLTDEQKDNIRRLLDNERQGIYILNRFKDLESKLKTNKEYNKWFDEVAMNTFMQTIPTKAVFYTFPRDLLYEIKGTHSRYELNREDFSGYSIWQTMYALDIIDPFLVALILGGKIENIEKHNYETYIKFIYKRKVYYAKRNSIELFTKDRNGNYIKLDDTIHTLLFRHYKEPIYKTLNSMMLPIGGYRVMPSEGFFDDPKIPELTSTTTEILNSDNYKTLSKKYYLGRSRVNPANM